VVAIAWVAADVEIALDWLIGGEGPNRLTRELLQEFGTMLDQVDGLQNKTTYAYDPLGHLKSMTTSATTACAGGCTTTYVFDALGKLATLVDPQQRTTTYGYDADNELISINYSDGHTPNVSNIKYDGNGHRKSMTDGTGTSMWTYDSLNRLTSSQDGAGDQVTYGYDLKSQLTSITYPGQSSGVIRTYDDAGRLSTVKDWLGNTTGFGYDADSNLTAETFPTGTNNVDTFTSDAGRSADEYQRRPRKLLGRDVQLRSGCCQPGDVGVV
jgi:YD repeat-containing protein